MGRTGTAALSPAVDSLLGGMTLEEKAGQVFVFTFVSLRQALNDLRFEPGGYVRIFSDALTVARESRELQARVKVPLIISADFERGIGSTISGAVDLVTMMALGAGNDEGLARECARAIAEEARAMGVNMNYVPVMDVNIEEENPIINVRAFGENPEMVARLGSAFIRGCREGGVMSCAKHFPGHGDTVTDTHTTLGSLGADRARMDRVELLPFRAAITAGVDSVMSAHMLVPAVEPERLPATLSRRVMTGLLREELGFEGVAVSDALEMGAIAKHFPAEEAIVRALNAGMDQLIMPTDNRRAVETVVNAVKDGRLSEDRLDEAVGRILRMKEQNGLLANRGEPPGHFVELLDTKPHREAGLRAALAGITLVRGAEALPLQSGKRVAVITFSNSEGERSYFTEPRTLGAHLQHEGLDAVEVHGGLLDERMVHEFDVVNRALAAADSADVVVLAAYTRVVINRGTVGLEPRYEDFVRQVIARGKPVVLVSFGNPYIIKQFPDAVALVCAYGSSEVTQQAAAMLLAGRAEFRGRLPVTITL